MTGSAKTVRDFKAGGVLDPTERFPEIIFGVIMAISFTGSVSIATGDHKEIRQVLIAALGCNLAWGIVDGIMYIVTNMIQRGREKNLIRQIMAETDLSKLNEIVTKSMPKVMAMKLPDAVIEEIRLKVGSPLNALQKPLLSRDDIAGAISICILVILSTIPLVLPFVLFQNIKFAMRLSNLTALIILFMCGVGLGHYAGFGRMRSGLAMALMGIILITIIMALGG